MSLSRIDSNSIAANAISTADLAESSITSEKIATNAITSAKIEANAITSAKIEANVSIQFAAGSVSAPSISTISDTNTGIFFPAADTIAFAEGGAEAMRIDSSGNVGIGTSSPAALLHLKSTTSGAPQLRIEGVGTDNGIITFLGGGHTNPAVGIRYISTGDSIGNLAFYANGSSSGTLTERMRIDSSGDLLVGLTAPNDNERFSVTTTTDVAILTRTANFTNYFAFICRNLSNSTVGSISCTATATAFNTSSDYRLKHDIQPMTGALAKVQQLKPVTYKWNADDSDGEGFIAHELQEVAPYAVAGEKDGEQMQGVDYGKITPLLTAALQEAIAEIQSLKARVAGLEAK